MIHWNAAKVGPDVLLLVAARDGKIFGIQFFEELPAVDGEPQVRDENHPVIREAFRQLEDYFEGRLRDFHLPLDPGGTQFQRRVWEALLAIPYGETRSYARIAAEIGSPKAVRAVGAANGANPIPIVIPCHRVVRTGGQLGGYGGGLDLKKMLLELESAKGKTSGNLFTLNTVS